MNRLSRKQNKSGLYWYFTAVDCEGRINFTVAHLNGRVICIRPTDDVLAKSVGDIICFQVKRESERLVSISLRPINYTKYIKMLLRSLTDRKALSDTFTG